MTVTGNQKSEGRVDPPSRDVFTLAMVCVPSDPPHAKASDRAGRPPARRVRPTEKLCASWSKSTSLRVTATLPWSAEKAKPMGPQMECSKASRRKQGVGGAKTIVTVAGEPGVAVDVRSAQGWLEVEGDDTAGRSDGLGNE